MGNNYTCLEHGSLHSLDGRLTPYLLPGRRDWALVAKAGHILPIYLEGRGYRAITDNNV